MKNKSYTSVEDTVSETEIQMYLASPVIPIKRDAIEIWEDMRALFPQISKIAMLYLSIVATYVPSEHLFSEAGATEIGFWEQGNQSFFSSTPFQNH